MPNQPYSRTPGKGKFLLTGMDLKHPPDLMPQGKCPYLLNVSTSRVQGAITGRAGLKRIAAVDPNRNAVHSIARLNNDIPGAPQSWTRFAAAGQSIYAGQNDPLQLVGQGYSGNPQSFVPYRPPQSPETWMYVYDSQKQAKYRVNGTEQNLGIAQPPTSCAATLTETQYRDLTEGVSAWQNSGAAGPASLFERVSPSGYPMTIEQIAWDTGSAPGWAIIMPTVSTSDYSVIGPGCLLTVGTGELPRPIFAMYPHMPSTTVDVASTDSGGVTPVGPAKWDNNVAWDDPQKAIWGPAPTTSASISAGLRDTVGAGVTTVQPAVCPPGLKRDAGVVINGVLTQVLSVTSGPDGNYSFRVDSTRLGFLPSPGMAIDFPVTFRIYLEVAHNVGDLLKSQVVLSLITGTTTGNNSVGQVYTMLPQPVDCSTVPAMNASQTDRPVDDEDYFHISFWTDQPENLIEAHFLLDVDASQNDFQHNVYYYIARQNDFQALSTGGSTVTNSLLNALTNQIAATYPISKDQIQFEQTNYPAAQVNEFGIPIAEQQTAGTAQWFEVLIKVNDLTRVGDDRSVGLWTVKALAVQAIVTENANIRFGSWWIAGGYGPDCNYNSYGNQGQPILYRYRYRSSLTGAFSEVSPAMRNGILAMRSGVLLTVVASPDTQVDLIDIERNGGTFDTWHRCLTVPNVSGQVLDDVIETVASAGDPLELLFYQPWPVTDRPKSGVCNITGNRVQQTSGDQFDRRWIRGVEFIVNNKTYSLFAPPYSTSDLELAENVGYFTGVNFLIPEATIAGYPLPYACQGPDGRIFATGDPYNPGNLYFSQPYSPENASDQGYIEVTGPSEPLGTPVWYEGALYVFSNLAGFRIEPTPGQANPYAAYRLGTVAGQVMPWAIDGDGPAIFYRGKDGIYAFASGGSQNLTANDLFPLLPFESRTGAAVTIAGQTIQPPDDSQPEWQRIAYANNMVYYSYLDQGGDVSCLAYSLDSKGWVLYQYAGGAICHYLEQGATNPLTLVGVGDGVMYAIDPMPSDNGDDFVCYAVTQADDQGDSRSTKQYGDVMLDAGYLTGGSSAGGSPSTSFVATTIYYDNFLQMDPQVTNVPASRRDQLLLATDVDNGHRNIGLIAQWSSSGLNVLYEWQPSYTIQPEESSTGFAEPGRPTDWFDAGMLHYKFVHGARIYCDTGGKDVTLQIEYDGGQKGPIVTVNSNGQGVVPVSFPPFKAHLMRLVPIGGQADGWRFTNVEWEVDPEPEVTPYWVTQVTTFDMGGFIHMRDLQFAYATTGPGGALTMTVDGTPYTLIANLPSTNGQEVKVYFPSPPAKGKLWQFSGIAPGLQIYRRDCEFRMKPWGAQQYQIVRGIGDDTRLSTGARM